LLKSTTVTEKDQKGKEELKHFPPFILEMMERGEVSLSSASENEYASGPSGEIDRRGAGVFALQSGYRLGGRTL